MLFVVSATSCARRRLIRDIRLTNYMPLPLSKRSQKVAAVLFTEPRLSQLTNRLIAEASENIPFHGKSSASDMDRVRFSIMKLASMPGANEDAIFDLAQTDWRDLFMAADFGYSADAHHKWYRSIVPDDNKDDDPPKHPWWAFWRRQ